MTYSKKDLLITIGIGILVFISLILLYGEKISFQPYSSFQADEIKEINVKLIKTDEKMNFSTKSEIEEILVYIRPIVLYEKKNTIVTDKMWAEIYIHFNDGEEEVIGVGTSHIYRLGNCYGTDLHYVNNLWDFLSE
ncbi:MAG: hypothetical protein E7256_16915 [Lachnospiraceae bacterium]|nr:hypothetical protein [Lachnospiraceae bacterium]